MFLRGLVYPTVENNRMVSPFFHFTLGDMFNKQPMIFQSLNYAVDTASTWEIKPGLRLPKLIQVSADMRVIDKTTPETTGKHYGLDWLPEGQTFRSFKPDLPSSLIPDYTKYGELWGEVSYPMVSDTDFMTLLDADDQIAGAKALIDSLKSDVDVPNFDIPKLPTDLF